MATFNYFSLVLIIFTCALMQSIDAMPKPKVKPTASKKAVKNLYSLMINLQKKTDIALALMNSVRNLSGYGPFNDKPECKGLPTYAIYKPIALTQKTLVGHLARMQRLLDSLYDALEGRCFAADITDKTLRAALNDVVYLIVRASLQLYKVDTFMRYPPAVKYDRKVLDKGIQLYLTCVGVPTSPTAKRILRYSTFVESLDRAMANMRSDIRYLKKCYQDPSCSR